MAWLRSTIEGPLDFERLAAQLDEIESLWRDEHGGADLTPEQFVALWSATESRDGVVHTREVQPAWISEMLDAVARRVPRPPPAAAPPMSASPTAAEGSRADEDPATWPDDRLVRRLDALRIIGCGARKLADMVRDGQVRRTGTSSQNHRYEVGSCRRARDQWLAVPVASHVDDPHARAGARAEAAIRRRRK